eukprot:TRINITY_DN34932_c0_g1_i1.p2 TRINITY_DN34932_c0_g1~~TRINITY_DN34932_c0_g1_i1.p2  ORF type:complete len:107 (-),score=35.21 TRINITY_DN34932_c0_g1_i1:89-409(-)
MCIRDRLKASKAEARKAADDEGAAHAEEAPRDETQPQGGESAGVPQEDVPPKEETAEAPPEELPQEAAEVPPQDETTAAPEMIKNEGSGMEVDTPTEAQAAAEEAV